MTVRPYREKGPPPWLLVWLPFLLGAGFLYFEESGDIPGAALARAGRAATAAGEPADALGRLLDMGPDYRAALAVRRMLSGGIPREAASAVVVERFQHWTGRSPASHVLGFVGAPAVPLLVPLLDDPRERVRQQAALALGDVGLAAAASQPALERLAARSTQDASTRAARNALGDVAPSGFAGWAWKIWYETPLAAVLALLLAPLALVVVSSRLRAGASPADTRATAPPAWVLPAAGAAGLAFLAFGLKDLLGERFTIEPDVWARAGSSASTCMAGLSLRLRRRAGGPAAPALRPPASSRSA